MTHREHNTDPVVSTVSQALEGAEPLRRNAGEDSFRTAGAILELVPTLRSDGMLHCLMTSLEQRAAPGSAVRWREQRQSRAARIAGRAMHRLYQVSGLCTVTVSDPFETVVRTADASLYGEASQTVLTVTAHHLEGEVLAGKTVHRLDAASPIYTLTAERFADRGQADRAVSYRYVPATTTLSHGEQPNSGYAPADVAEWLPGVEPDFDERQILVAMARFVADNRSE